MNNSDLLCSECGAMLIESPNAEIVCTSCGLVHDRVFATSGLVYKTATKAKESPQFMNEVGQTVLNPTGNGSIMTPSAVPRYMTPNALRLLNIYKRYTAFVNIRNHETECRIALLLQDVGRYFDMSYHIVEDAMVNYRRIVRHCAYIRNHVTLAATSFYTAIQDRHLPYSIEQICGAFSTHGHRVWPKLITRDILLYKIKKTAKTTAVYMQNYLIKVEESPEAKVYFMKKNPDGDWATHMQQLTHSAVKMLAYFERKTFNGLKPTSVAAAMVVAADRYIAIKLGNKRFLRLDLMSKIVDVSDYSIRDVIVKYLSPLFNVRVWC